MEGGELIEGRYFHNWHSFLIMVLMIIILLILDDNDKDVALI